eukprot:2547960-Rhodomonas_salina.8
MGVATGSAPKACCISSRDTNSSTASSSASAFSSPAWLTYRPCSQTHATVLQRHRLLVPGSWPKTVPGKVIGR